MPLRRDRERVFLVLAFFGMRLTMLHKQIEYLFSPRSAPNWSGILANRAKPHRYR